MQYLRILSCELQTLLNDAEGVPLLSKGCRNPRGAGVDVKNAAHTSFGNAVLVVVLSTVARVLTVVALWTPPCTYLQDLKLL